jgi:hypothetical protein
VFRAPGQGPEAVTMLFDAKTPKPRRKIGRYLLLGLAVLFLGVLLGFIFRNYGEERAVARFLTALERGDYREAYRLWQPSPSYSYADFLRDWGEQGDYGRIREFRILNSKSKGSRTVVVKVRINNVDPPLEIAVDRESKGLAYSIF